MAEDGADRRDPAAEPEREEKLRLGGMALRNGLLVHGPTSWAVAVRTAASVGAIAGSYAAAAVAVMYVALAWVALRLMRRAPTKPCGCLGASSAPASRAHVVVNLSAAAVALAAAFDGSPLTRIPSPPLQAVTFVVLVLVAARLAALTIDALPLLTRAAKEGSTA